MVLPGDAAPAADPRARALIKESGSIAIDQALKAMGFLAELKSVHKVIHTEGVSQEEVKAAIDKLADSTKPLSDWTEKADILNAKLEELSSIPGYEIPRDLLDAAAADQKAKNEQLENAITEINQVNEILSQPDLTQEQQDEAVERIHAIYLQYNRKPTAEEIELMERLSEILSGWM